MELKDCMGLLLPEDELGAVSELIEEFREGELEEFFDRYPELLGGYDDVQTFLEEVEDEVICLGTILVWYLMERGVVMAVDWDGEEEENLLADYVNYRLETAGADFSVDTEGFYRRARETGCTDEVWELLQNVDRQLSGHGFRLLGFDTQCEPESVYVGVFREELAEALLAVNVTDVYVARPADL